MRTTSLFLARQREDRAERLPEIGRLVRWVSGESRCADRHYRLGGRKRTEVLNDTLPLRRARHRARWFVRAEGYPAERITHGVRVVAWMHRQQPTTKLAALMYVCVVVPSCCGT